MTGAAGQAQKTSRKTMRWDFMQMNPGKEIIKMTEKFKDRRFRGRDGLFCRINKDFAMFIMESYSVRDAYECQLLHGSGMKVIARGLCIKPKDINMVKTFMCDIAKEHLAKTADMYAAGRDALLAGMNGG